MEVLKTRLLQNPENQIFGIFATFCALCCGIEIDQFWSILEGWEGLIWVGRVTSSIQLVNSKFHVGFWKIFCEIVIIERLAFLAEKTIKSTTRELSPSDIARSSNIKIL